MEPHKFITLVFESMVEELVQSYNRLEDDEGLTHVTD